MDEYVDVSEAIEALGVGAWAIERAVERGQLEGDRLFGAARVRRRSIEKAIREGAAWLRRARAAQRRAELEAERYRLLQYVLELEDERPPGEA